MAHSDYYPTSLWRVGEPVLDRYEVAVPPGTPAGQYMLKVALYGRDGARWLTEGEDIAPLAEIRVGP
jgi:hypothetical protein